MRRKSERQREKEKSSPEKKTDKGNRRSRRHSRRRRKSSSSSDHDSTTEENETSYKSNRSETERQREKIGKDKVSRSSTETKEKDDETSKLSSGSVHKSNKQNTVDPGGSKTVTSPVDDDWKEDKSFWEGDDTKVDTTDSKHREKEEKSSVWQVKNSIVESGSNSGEIQKIKLCIVRPSETSEPGPQRRKRLSRSSSSHKDKSDSTECAETDDHRKDGKKLHESSENKEVQESVAGTKEDLKTLEDRENLRNSKLEGELEERSEHQSPSRKTSDSIISPEEELQTKQSSEEDKVSVKESPDEESTSLNLSEIKHSVQDSETVVEESDVVSQSLDDFVKESTDDKDERSDISKDQIQLKENVVKQEEILEKKDSGQISSDEESEPGNNEKEKSQVKIDQQESSEEKVKNTSEKQDSENETEPKHIILSKEESVECALPEEKQKSRDSSEEPCEMEKNNSEDRLPSHSPERLGVSNSLEEGQIQDSSEENSPQETLKMKSKVYDKQVNQSPKESREKSNKQVRGKRVSLEERSHSRDSSEEKPRGDGKKRRQSRESNSSRSFSCSPEKQTRRRGDRDTTRRNRIPDSDRTDKHKKKDNNKSPERQGSRHSNRRSRSPQRQREKISLRRSFSSKRSDSHGVENAEHEDSKKEMSADDAHPQIKEDKENVRKTSEQSEPLQSVTKRRRWGAGKSSRTGKKPVLSISTDSLKNLIPGAKPVSISEVQLCQEEEENRRDRESEGQEREGSENKEKSRNKNKDTQETANKKMLGPVTVAEPHKISVAVTDDRKGKVVTRKISIVSDDARTLQNSPSPPRHKASNVLFISNLVRPFTVNQLKELLARTGTIVEGGFWIDKIKSKCYVQYETETEARETRHALHGVRWPVSNPKQLCVDFGKKEDMDLAQALTEDDQIPRKTEPLKVERTVEGWVAEQVREKEREREMRERERERERVRTKERSHHAVPAMEALERNRNMKMSTSVREWDLGKISQFSPTEREPKHEEKNRERERRMRREKHHSRSPSPHDVPARKQKKKEEDAPAKLLDDLFRKTKSTPCIYWLPLTAEQIVVKEEMRRRHMAEHERRMAEMRKVERERERARAQQRQQRRTGDRDKRRRRTTSGSPKK